MSAPIRPESESDVDALIRLLEWGRKNGVRIGPELTIGCISVKVADLRQSKKEGLMQQPEMNILAEHGWSPEDDQ